MKKIIFLFLILPIFCLCLAAQTTKKSRQNRFPVSIEKMSTGTSDELLNDPVIQSRLKRLLGGKNYASFLESFETQNPVEKNGVILFSSGCLIHACGHLESAVAIDLASRTVHAAIFRENEKVKYFNENTRKTPVAIKNWANNLTRKN